MSLNCIKAIAMTELESTLIDGAFEPINPLGLPNACCLINIINATTEDITISYDGVTHQDYIVAGTTRTYNFQTNNQPSSKMANLPKGQIVYASGTTGTGFVYLSGYYIPQ